ncbi:hypothetical protein QYE76_030887 [Lolium multiflorum]|uniref:Aminotransferase-like plant mobile domain-containing protein n=1 Tax=Lolium multiflorum TaxID=4521 RepID=A0AAD8QTY1_LOLMU|nr:hypothetical protein QYE76_030887 [Lolium multiflorum]
MAVKMAVKTAVEMTPGAIPRPGRVPEQRLLSPELEFRDVAAPLDVFWSFREEVSKMVWLLDEEYDREHRAVHMTERETDLHPLKIRYHGTSDIPYDERYTEFIRPTGLMPFISLVSRGGPHMNPSALTALVDRWRPETHTFHLRAGEMAPTLQDVSMILALPIQGEPLCINTASDGWRQQMEGLIGRAPPAPENPKQRVPAGASFEWIRTNFGECPIEADEDTRRTYARVYLWYMISRTLFPDSGGKLAHWCWLKALTVLDDRWSWGTAALAYLYRQIAPPSPHLQSPPCHQPPPHRQEPPTAANVCASISLEPYEATPVGTHDPDLVGACLADSRRRSRIRGGIAGPTRMTPPIRLLLFRLLHQHV